MKKDTTVTAVTAVTALDEEKLYGPFDPIRPAERIRYQQEFRDAFPVLSAILHSAPALKAA